MICVRKTTSVSRRTIPWAQRVYGFRMFSLKKPDSFWLWLFSFPCCGSRTSQFVKTVGWKPPCVESFRSASCFIEVSSSALLSLLGALRVLSAVPLGFFPLPASFKRFRRTMLSGMVKNGGAVEELIFPGY